MQCLLNGGTSNNIMFPLLPVWISINQQKQHWKPQRKCKHQLTKTKPNNASSFNDKPSSTFQLVVASVNWKSKAISNKLFRILCLGGIKSKMPFIFQLIVGSKQMHRTKLQQVRVDAWLSNTISWHGPDSHESNCASQLATRSKCLKPHKSSCASKVACAKCLNSHKSSCASKVVHAKCLNSHKSSCASLLVARAKCLDSHESSCPSLLVVHAKPLKSNKTQRMTPSLSLKFIGKFGGSTICFSYFPSIQVNCCFNFYHQLPVDCWPIFESKLWGSTCSANHIRQIFHADCWI